MRRLSAPKKNVNLREQTLKKSTLKWMYFAQPAYSQNLI